MSLLGNYTHPLWGNISATTYLPYETPSYSTDADENVRLDSMVLAFRYTGYSIGDTTKPLKVRIHRLQERVLTNDNGYIYSHTSFSYDPNPLATYTFVPKLDDNEPVEIRLSDELGEEMLTRLHNRDDGVSGGEPGDGGEPASLPDWYYTGGELGTSFVTSQTAFEQPTPVVDADPNMTDRFNRGEQLFEKPYTTNFSGVRHGLGPVYIRTSCTHCHPGYGHGKSQPEGSFNTTQIGNGYLLVVYNPATNAYVSWLAGMPQTKAVAPFKAPLDESQIRLSWHEYTDDWGNEFPDGEKYALRYPEVEIPQSAIYVANKGYDVGDYEVRLESTIGIYGTGLLDAGDPGAPEELMSPEVAQDAEEISIAPLWSQEEIYRLIPEEVPKARARRTGADHAEMLPWPDGYMTAWFRYWLMGDEAAGAAFLGPQAELAANPLWQDVEKNL